MQHSSKNIPKEINDLTFAFFFLVIGSHMLTNEEEDQLLKWIDGSKKCDFKLLYKATHHGFGSAEFHKKCDGKGATISIIKSEQQCIFGGYVSKSWQSERQYISDNYAWLYSLRNKKGIRKKFKIVQHKECAVCGGNDFGPSYGIYDLAISNNCNENEGSYTNLGQCYEAGAGPHQLNDGTLYFKVLDYEIWQIISK